MSTLFKSISDASTAMMASSAAASGDKSSQLAGNERKEWIDLDMSPDQLAAVEGAVRQVFHGLGSPGEPSSWKATRCPVQCRRCVPLSLSPPLSLSCSSLQRGRSCTCSTSQGQPHVWSGKCSSRQSQGSLQLSRTAPCCLLTCRCCDAAAVQVRFISTA